LMEYRLLQAISIFSRITDTDYVLRILITDLWILSLILQCLTQDVIIEPLLLACTECAFFSISNNGV
jgi:hypothetical protein